MQVVIETHSEHIPEIVKNLAVLNDEAICLYNQYRTNLKKAMEILSSKLLECSPDPEHIKELTFRFSYEEKIEDQIVQKNKDIECSPHLKLIRKDSDLRIYFMWCDSDVGKNEKVLVGHIGDHPY